jgi:hypothetical protein
VTGRWHAPCDPECPELEVQLDHLWSDPMTEYSGVGDEIAEDIERRHLRECRRCQQYAAEHIDVR